jgi:sugar/nucleoside kinase (ribokinase family)
MNIDVVGVGLAVIDIKETVSSIPGVDETVLAFDCYKHMGGPVANALAQLNRLGMKTSYMGALGDDEYGNLIADTMKAEGIDTSSLKLLEGEASAFSIVLVDSATKKSSISFFPGCGLSVPEDCIDTDAFKSAKLLHVDIFTPAVQAACNAAKREGVPISVDADALFPGLEEILEMADIFIPAREISAQLVGEDDPETAGRMILEKYNLSLVVVTRGKGGSITITPEETVGVEAFDIDPVDTTGAGGVFQGAYLYAHLQGWPLERSARFANAAAALMCSGMNGWDDIPTLARIEEFLKERGVGF